MKKNKTLSLKTAATLGAFVVGMSSAAASFAAATIVIVNGNAAGVGFNDTTVAAPVGGNSGTTLGQQRLIAFQAAAAKWGATLTSSVPITVLATMEPLACTATTATLGSAGATQIFSDFPGAPLANSWYSYALTNKLYGAEALGDQAVPQIRARFNSNLGLNANCLPGSPFYLGLDGNAGNLVDLVTVLEHEFAHGLGFQTFTNGATGAQLGGTPSVWDNFMWDNTAGKRWVDMTDAERATSSLNFRKLAWTGPNVSSKVPTVLAAGTQRLNISGPNAADAAGDFPIGTASFGVALSSPGVTGQLMPVVDQTNGTGLACNPLSGVNALAVNGRIALIDRGVCGFAVKAKNAQDAGAIGVVIANNAAGTAPGLGGADPTVVIPTLSVSQADGILLKSKLGKRTRTSSGVIANLGVDPNQYAGADKLGRALLFTPNPYQSGSSVSHWDTLAFPNQLMEPAINADLTHEVTVPYDLTFELLKDIGW
ncbi:PA domain-containing protein [Undibacterium terreum]|uniref:Serine protease n=1 Tax=Undibacterium terreum TaxID=1224302 RepID=A0A916UDQ0_9BURK|nr:PA domain-containing protein [Undibacterium terreum]GGC68590.1 serine protease [Undibacterium terreum]